MTRQVLFISIDGMTDPLGQSQVIPYLSGLRKAGYSITILSAEKKNKLASAGSKIEQLLKENDISWEKITYKNKLPFVSQALNFLALRRKASRICSEKKITLIHARSYIPALIALYLKKTKSILFLFDMRGFWADERVEGKLWDLKKPLQRRLYNFFKKKEAEFYEESSHIISLTHNAKEEILRIHSNLPAEKITVIPCCADFELFNFETADISEMQKLRVKNNIGENDFLLTYSGSLGTWYMLPEMLRFFKLLLLKKPESRFLILTTDPEEIVLSEAGKMNLSPDRILVRSAGRNEMPLYLNMSDLCIFFIRPGFSKKASSPTKLAEILGCGIPVVTNSGIGDVDSLFQNHHCGFLLNDFSEENFARIIELIDTEKFNKTELRETAIKNFDLNSGINSYITVYKKILYG